jgi:hypothetical protein
MALCRFADRRGDRPGRDRGTTRCGLPVSARKQVNAVQNGAVTRHFADMARSPRAEFSDENAVSAPLSPSAIFSVSFATANIMSAGSSWHSRLDAVLHKATDAYAAVMKVKPFWR